MQLNFRLSVPATCLGLAAITSAQAVEPMPLQQASFKRIQQQFQLVLPGVANAGGAPDTLQFIQQRTDKNHVTHVRMQQQYLGFEVYGGYAIMHSKATAMHLLNTQNNVWMNGVLYRGLPDELGQPSADFIKNTIVALQQFKAHYQGKDVSEEQVTPMVYIDNQHQAHWAYRVSMYIRHEHQIPERSTAILDAKTHKSFIQWNDIKTARMAVKGTGYGGNSKTGQYLFGKTFPLLDLTYDNLLKTCYMENAAVRVVDMEHKYHSLNLPMKFRCRNSQDNNPLTFWTGYRNDGYDKINGGFSPTNDALYFGYAIKHMYRDWYDIEVLSKKGNSMQIVMRVHYGEGYDNAYWDGRQMTFGDGDLTSMYPLVSLGIGAHEISHGFTEQHSNLQYTGHSGGLNESFSDMAAQAAEFYSTGKNTWLIGAEIMKKGSGIEALRYMDKPSRDGQSIDSAEQYYEALDVHYSSGVYNRLFYLMSTLSGWNPRKAFEVMVKANMDYWTPTATFDEAGCGVLNATHDFGFSVDDVKKSLAAVAVNFDSCVIGNNG
ncbi:zinc metalloprotease ProA [Legionella maceachernii]|uniref:Neutral metalloproteinase n=2 Tax=Legionella maceachernii TaxID=466 RepID=A0A0W0VV81_9GAMM|nr:M4 family metallopeptidase [Legionella maceachernii]KTD23976.1 zinc metalloproteinase precursor [Legionella maceachernii]SKA19194.1 Msp peptidase. Metallo peptidase. MEROPS family M04 [Legionella maceachernii]SUP04409.1 Zinc metalloproteinase precursor [Legionella maceachernii]